MIYQCVSWWWRGLMQADSSFQWPRNKVNHNIRWKIVPFSLTNVTTFINTSRRSITIEEGESPHPNCVHNLVSTAQIIALHMLTFHFRSFLMAITTWPRLTSIPQTASKWCHFQIESKSPQSHFTSTATLAWEHFCVHVEIIWWWTSYLCIRLQVNVHRSFDSLVDISGNYKRYNIPVWDCIDEISRRPSLIVRGWLCVFRNFWGHFWTVWVMNKKWKGMTDICCEWKCLLDMWECLPLCVVDFKLFSEL